MKKIINHIFSIIFMIFLILNYFYFIINRENNNTPVFYYDETEELYYDYYYITFNNLNTKNFDDIIKKFEYKDFKILTLYTTPNTEYNDKLIDKLKEYNYDNIENFIKYYINNLNYYKLDEHINNININGIKIDKILIYTSEENIKRFQKKLKDITYTKKEIMT